MADIDIFIRENQNYFTTFKETSYDSSNNNNLCQDTSTQVINFDKMVEDKYPDSNVRPKSFDAIYIYEQNIFCIEFKNQKPANIDNSEVQKKLEDGKEELVKLLQDKNIQIRNYNFIYCVVYKDCKEPFDRYKCGVGKNSVLFGLEKYKNSFVKEVITQNVSFYTKEFKKLFKKELTC